MKISHNIGPGYGNNALNNKSTAEHLSDLLLSDLAINQPGSEMVGCICHIANLAAMQYILGECKSAMKPWCTWEQPSSPDPFAANCNTKDYYYNPNNIPAIHVIGALPSWSMELNDKTNKDKEQLVDQVAEEAIEEDDEDEVVGPLTQTLQDKPPSDFHLLILVL